MQLVALLLPAILLATVQALSFEERREAFKGRLRAVKDRLKNRHANATEETKRKIARVMGGIDPEARKARLERLQKRANRLGEKVDVKLKERLAKIQPVETERISEDAPVNLYEVNAMQGVDSYMFQSDIHLTEEQLDQMEAEKDGKRVKRAASSTATKWTDNTLYFYFDSSITERKKASVRAAHAYIQSRTCVKFVESSTAFNRVKVYNGSGCFAELGMVPSREQDMSLGDGCESVGTAAHEFAHALGFWHTQMRSDRDDFIDVDISAVDPKQAYNFEKLASSELSLTTPYEYGSVMHYPSNAFTLANRLAMVPKDTRFAYTMGNNQLTFYDIQMINDHYGCNAKCNPVNSQICKNGGYPNPNDCKVCVCPLGYAGATCEERPSGCGSALTAITTWKSINISVGDNTNIDKPKDDFVYCNYWIQAPAGYSVVTRITRMFNSFCTFGCQFGGLETKGDVDQRKTNQRFCCPEFYNQNVTSYVNPTPVVVYNRFYVSDYTLEYIAVPTSSVPTVTVPAPTTTTTPAPTTPKIPNRNCKSTLSNTDCENNKSLGFCQVPHPTYSYQVIKYNCAVECGLCGKASATCADDANTDCVGWKNNGVCEQLDPMVAEYFCPQSCGYCTYPN